MRKYTQEEFDSFKVVNGVTQCPTGEQMKLRITNLKNGLSKTIDATNYTMEDLEKTYLAYEGREKFIVKIIR
jgi:hypothetical protein